MVEKFITIVFLSLIGCVGFTQTREAIDSLHQQMAIAKDDTSRIKAQAFLCLLYRLGNTDSSIYYGQQALKSAQQINYPEGEILALGYMSITMEQIGNLSKALEMAFKALQIAKANNLECEAALNAIGETYILLKDYPKALRYLNEQKSICESNGNIEALAYAKKDIAVVFEEMDQLDSAWYYVQLAIDDFQKTGREEPQTYQTLGNIKMKSGNNAEALNFYQSGLKIAINNNERRASAEAYNKIATFYKKINQPDSGIYYARKGLEESQLISQKKTLQEAAALLSELYEQNDTKESLRYLKIADAYKDSLFGAGNLQAIQALINQQEEHQKEIEASRIRYQNNLRQYVLIVGLGILLFVSAILYRNNRQKQKSNKVLATALSNLRATQTQLIHSEKMASLGELTAGIAHEIQNPLNFVNNFSEINQELSQELEEELKVGKMDDAISLSKDIKENSEKISQHGKRAEAIVKSMLQHSRTSSGERELTDINALCDEYLRLAFHGFRAKDKSFNASYRLEPDESLLKLRIVPQDIGRVLLNIINNAFQAVQNEKNPIISVSTKQLNEQVEIRITDNGPGIPDSIKDKIFQPFFTTKPTGQGTGLGLSLAHDIVKAHGGTIHVNSKEGEGTEFVIQLPVV